MTRCLDVLTIGISGLLCRGRLRRSRLRARHLSACLLPQIVTTGDVRGDIVQKFKRQS